MKLREYSLLSSFNRNKFTNRDLEADDSDSSDGHNLLEKDVNETSTTWNGRAIISKFVVLMFLLILAASLLLNVALFFELRKFLNLDRVCSFWTSQRMLDLDLVALVIFC
jgi:hypothetical protein